jgi:hypothetical protein
MNGDNTGYARLRLRYMPDCYVTWPDDAGHDEHDPPQPH